MTLTFLISTISQIGKSRAYINKTESSINERNVWLIPNRDNVDEGFGVLKGFVNE